MKTFYMGMKDQFLVIDETKEGYTFTTYLEGMKANRLAIDPQNEKRMYVATDKGLWRTEDAGEKWTQADKGIKKSNITAVAIHPKRRVNGNSVVYVGTEPSALYYSEDNGKSWTEFSGIQELPSKSEWSFPPRPETHYVRWITPNYTDENYIAVSIEAGAVIHTTDHGKTWNDRTAEGPIDVHTLLNHPDVPARLYAANGDGSSNPKKAFAESEDGGQSWEYMSEGLEEHPYLYNMILRPNNPEKLFVSASKSAAKAHRSPRYSTVYRKYGGEAWEETAEGLPREGAYTHHLANDPNDVNGFYALNNFGIYWLGVEETTWEKVDLAWPEEYKEERPYFFVVK